jgi:hypothetical protein
MSALPAASIWNNAMIIRHRQYSAGGLARPAATPRMRAVDWGKTCGLELQSVQPGAVRVPMTENMHLRSPAAVCCPKRGALFHDRFYESTWFSDRITRSRADLACAVRASRQGLATW